jgi:hypothetical protein
MRYALNRTAANAALGGNLQHTLAGPPLILDASHTRPNSPATKYRQ